MHDAVTVAWKEWRELLRMSGTRRRASVGILISIGFVGIIWPWQIGTQFVTSKLAVLFAALTGSMYVAGVVPDSFAGERERHTLETLLATRLSDGSILAGKILALISYGLTAAFVMLLFGVVTVNIAHGSGEILLYSFDTLISALIAAIASIGLVAAVGVLVSLRAGTVKQAQQVMSTAMLVVLFLPVILLPALPATWRSFLMRLTRPENAAGLTALSAGGLLVMQLVLYAIVIARFKRSRLILEE